MKTAIAHLEVISGTPDEHALPENADYVINQLKIALDSIQDITPDCIHSDGYTKGQDCPYGMTL
ncbi:hypothetical protein LCGC14_0264600 [marine sediment metagenome]|uniref:Uncharacterized protein n=1 Tax=marine sediment metagenome TaxID=412755 RepID=A0A0F9UHR7_9ZZZZ